MKRKRECFYKPLLKWVGGKTQLLDKLTAHFPQNIANYHEVFVGGGSVLLSVLSLMREGQMTIGRVYAYDSNEGLIYFYKNIQNNKDKLYRLMNEYLEKYNNIERMTIDAVDNKELRALRKVTKETTTSREAYYYWLRHEFNQLDKKSVEYSALFYVLNKLCFRGLFRESSSGFNVPFGHYKNIGTVSMETMDDMHALIANVVFECCDFRESISRAKKGDFMYLDPPYVPEKASSFVGYTEGGFNRHEELFECIKKQSVQFVLSNSNAETVLKAFAEYSVDKVEAKRAINSKKPGAKTKELIIYNTKM